MRQIPLGAKGSFSLLVQPEHLANRFKDAILPPVFATPMMIMVMENAALNAIRAYLDPGRERGRHGGQRAPSRADPGWTPGYRGGRGDESRRAANRVRRPSSRGFQGDRCRLAFQGC